MFALHTSSTSRSSAAEVEGGDRSRLAAAGPRAPALQPGPERPTEDVVRGLAATPSEQRLGPARGACTSSSTNTISSPGPRRGPRCGRRWRRAARARQRGRRVAGHRGGGGGPDRCRRPAPRLRPAGLRHDRGERDLEIGRAVPRSGSRLTLWARRSRTSIFLRADATRPASGHQSARSQLGGAGGGGGRRTGARTGTRSAGCSAIAPPQAPRLMSQTVGPLQTRPPASSSGAWGTRPAWKSNAAPTPIRTGESSACASRPSISPAWAPRFRPTRHRRGRR